MKSIKEYGKIMQDAFKSAVWSGFDCVSLSNNDYTQKDVERFNKESEEPIFDLCIEGGMETADEIDDITFLGGFGLCFRESENI